MWQNIWIRILKWIIFRQRNMWQNISIIHHRNICNFTEIFKEKQIGNFTEFLKKTDCIIVLHVAKHLDSDFICRSHGMIFNLGPGTNSYKCETCGKHSNHPPIRQSANPPIRQSANPPIRQ